MGVSFDGTRWAVIAAWLLAAIAALVLIVRVEARLERPLNVFPSYYTAARLIASGENVAQFYDDRWFMRRAAEFEPLAPEIHNANTPVMGVFFPPLVNFSYDTARKLTSALVFAALIAAGFLIAAELKIEGAWRAVAFAGMFVSPTTLTNL